MTRAQKTRILDKLDMIIDKLSDDRTAIMSKTKCPNGLSFSCGDEHYDKMNKEIGGYLTLAVFTDLRSQVEKAK